MSELFPDTEVVVPTDPEELKQIVKGKLEADRFIEKLKTENGEMRQELQTRLTVEEMMEKMARPQPVAPNPTPTPPQGEPTNNQGGEARTSEAEVQETVAKLIEAERTKENQTRNRALVVTQLQEAYGADYPTYVAKAASELGVAREFLEGMADKTPEALVNLVKKTVGLPDNRPGTPPASAVNTAAELGDVTRKNNAYYSKLRRENPKLYYTAKLQNEMMKEAIAQGDAFYT